MRALIIAGLLVLTSTAASQAQDAAAGEKVFWCMQNLSSDWRNCEERLGPAQNGIIGRKAGTYPGYAYSDANKNSALTWGTSLPFASTSRILGAKFPAPR